MDKITIHQAKTEEDLDTVQTMTGYAFGVSPVLELDRTKREYRKTSSRYLLSVDGKPQSTLTSIPMTHNVRGKVFTMQGIAGVASYPEARMQGHVKRLMDHALINDKDRGMTFSTLYPFKQSFYSKFGYITLPHSREVTFNPGLLRHVNGISTNGKIERYKVSKCIDRYFEFLKTYERRHHGFSLFDRETHQQFERSKLWAVFVVVDGRDMGLMTYNTAGFEKDMSIRNFLYLDSNAKYQLLKHIAVHRDQFLEVNMKVLAFERPENWVLDSRMRISSRKWVPSAMGRVLDVRKIFGMKVGEGSMIINLRDNNCPWNNGTWRLESDNEELSVSVSEETPDLEMCIHGLSAIIYGSYEMEDLIIRGWVKGDTSIIENMFPPTTPEIYTSF